VTTLTPIRRDVAGGATVPTPLPIGMLAIRDYPVGKPAGSLTTTGA